ncbi:small heat shock protein-like protein, partial [Leptotrombidium deliense]
KEEAGGFVSRQFMRRIPILEDVELDQMNSTLSAKGVLTITAPKKQVKPKMETRVIPIEVYDKEVKNDVIGEEYKNEATDPNSDESSK